MSPHGLPTHPSSREETWHTEDADNLVRVVLRNIYAFQGHEDLMTTHMEVRIDVSDEECDWIAVPGSRYRSSSPFGQATRDKAAARFHGDWVDELLRAGTENTAWSLCCERVLRLAATKKGGIWLHHCRFVPRDRPESAG